MGNKSSKKANQIEKSNKNQVEPANRANGGDGDNPDGNWRPQTVLSVSAKRQFEDSVDRIVARTEIISAIPYEEFEYPFENLVFEGGGAKGQVYVGCLQIIDKIGLNAKRFAGASAGAICAALLAAGYSCKELEKILEMDLKAVLIDHSCGIFSLLPNLIRNFGWNPGKKFEKEFGSLLAKKQGNPDVTFMQLYKDTGRELCITAVNVNMLAVEYFHPKTTPNVPIRKAVRMSLSIPGVFEAVRFKNSRGQIDTYIDGGLLCNYPIHAFDGWWLSMKSGDSFLNRLQPLSSMHKLMDKQKRFDTFNEKTLGFLVYSSMEQDVMQTELDKRVGTEEIVRPKDSALYKSRADVLKSKKEAMEEHEVFMHSLDRFMKLMQRVNRKPAQTLKNLNGDQAVVDDVIDKAELKQAIREAMSRSSPVQGTPAGDLADHEIGELDTNDVEVLFGQNIDIDVVFDDLDINDNGFISFDELLIFIEKSGIDIQSKFQGYDRRELNSLGDFILGLQDCLLTNVKKMYLDERDLERTVGINTDYISTTDFRMEQVDREFCYEQGRRATEAFLKHYVNDKKPKRAKRAKPSLSESGNHLHSSDHHHASNLGQPSDLPNGRGELPSGSAHRFPPLSENTATFFLNAEDVGKRLPPLHNPDIKVQKSKRAKLPPIGGAVSDTGSMSPPSQLKSETSLNYHLKSQSKPISDEPRYHRGEILAERSADNYGSNIDDSF